MDAILILIFVVVFLCSFLFLSKPRGLPPGPLTFPGLGSVFFLKELRKNRAHLYFHEASKRYGKIFSFRAGSQLIVVLHGYDTIHQALVKQSQVFSDRPTFLPQFQRAIFNAKEGIVFRGYTHQWKTLRRFTLQTLKDFGVGKTSIEDRISIEIDAASREFQATSGKPIEIAPFLQKIVGNVIYGIVFGKRFDFNDPDIDLLQKMSNIAVSGQGPANAANFLPRWFSRTFAKKSYDEIQVRRQNFQKIRTYILDLIKEHEDSYDGNNIRDFVDLYIKVSRDSKEERADIFSQGSMLQVISELFIAGSETTYNTLNWAFLFMAEYPEIQARCIKEIEDNVGDKHIEFTDRSKMPYIDATVSEIQRHGNVVPLSVMHCTSEDTTLLGYRIPKKTVVMPSLYSANMDPKYWRNPHEFQPARFLDDKGKMKKCDALVSFSTGPRVCLGEPLAKMELFLIFANLLQRFEFRRENDNVKHSMELKPNQATSAPFPYKLRIKGRSV